MDNRQDRIMARAPVCASRKLHIYEAGQTVPIPGYSMTLNEAGTVPAYHLSFITYGRATVRTGDTEQTASAGDFVFLSREARHEIIGDSTQLLQRLYVTLDGSLARALFAAYGLTDAVRICPGPVQEPLQNMLRTLHQYQNTRPPLGKLALLLHQILQNACADGLLTDTPEPAFEPAAPRKAEAERTHRPPLKAGDLQDYLDEALERRVTMEELETRFQRSAAQLTRVLRAATGQSPKQYLLSRKLEEACRLLTDTDLSVEEIAARLAFYSHNHFSQTFLAHQGVTPLKYRRESRMKTVSNG